MAEYHLKVGESKVVRPRWWGKSWSVIYAGMLPNGAFSVAIVWTMGHNSAAYNLYLAEDRRDFLLPVGKAEVLDVSPDEMRFRFEGRA